MLFAVLVTALLSSCMNTQKSLILYYSQTGATEKLATELQKQTGADIERIDVEDVYDGDFKATIERVKGERKKGVFPTLIPVKSDVSKYEVIYLAYPVWFGTYAPPVAALLQSVKLEGKTIVPVCTFGSGGLESSTADLVATLPSCTIAQGFGIRNARLQHVEEELNRFLIENGYKEGKVDPLPEYSAQETVSEEQVKIYDEATAGYPFPMGNPVSAGSRTMPGGVDYLFTVLGTSPEGQIAEGKVFISVREGLPAEFTKVIR